MEKVYQMGAQFTDMDWKMKIKTVFVASLLAFIGIVHAQTGMPRTVLELSNGKGNPRNSEGDFARLKDGRVLFVYSHYNGASGDDHGAAYLAGRLSKDGGQTWGPDFTVIENEGGQNVMSVSLLRLQDGRLAMFYLRKNSSQDCRPVMRVSADEGATWSAPTLCIADADIGYYVLNNDRALQLKRGRIVLPLARHPWLATANKGKGGIDGRGELTTALSDDGGRTWRLGKERALLGFNALGKRVTVQEPGVVELKDGRVLMYIRTDTGRHSVAYSSDGAETWTKPEPWTLFSPLAPASITRLKHGDLVAVWNDHERFPEQRMRGPKWSGGYRAPQTIGISKDEGRTWIHRKELESDMTGWYCYTAILEMDGFLLLEYCARNGLGWSRIMRVPLDWIYASSDEAAVLCRKISDCDQYTKLNPVAEKAFAFLKRSDLRELKPGRYEIDGTNCWANVMEVDLKPLEEEMTYEAHRTYMDIQAPLSGPESYGVMMTPVNVGPFNAEKDCVLFKGKGARITLQPGEFVIFGSSNAHAPGRSANSARTIRKLIIKVLLP